MKEEIPENLEARRRKHQRERRKQRDGIEIRLQKRNLQQQFEKSELPPGPPPDDQGTSENERSGQW